MMKRPTTHFGKIDHKILLLTQIKSVLKRQFKLLKALSHAETNIPNEIKENTLAYLDIFKEFDLEYYKFIQEVEKQNKVLHNHFLQQVKENYTTFRLFKDELVDECLANNISIKIDAADNKDMEMTIAHGYNNSKPSFWKKLLCCGYNIEKNERLIEMTAHNSHLKP